MTIEANTSIDFPCQTICQGVYDSEGDAIMASLDFDRAYVVLSKQAERVEMHSSHDLGMMSSGFLDSWMNG
jgi:hypothetical protein